METGPAPPAQDCKFLQAAARQPGEGAAAPGRAGGAAAASRPHLKEKRARKRRWWRRRRGRRKKTRRSEERRRKRRRRRKATKKGTEPERRRRHGRGRKRQQGVFLARRFPSPLSGPSLGFRAPRLRRARGEAGPWVGSHGAARRRRRHSRAWRARGSPLSTALGAPASPRSPPRSPLRRAWRRRRHRESLVPSAPGPSPAGRPLPSRLRRTGARPASASWGGRRWLRPWAPRACPGSACWSCWSTPAPRSTAKPRKVRKEGRAAAGLPGLGNPRAGTRFPRGRAGAGRRAAVRTWHS